MAVLRACERHPSARTAWAVEAGEPFLRTTVVEWEITAGTMASAFAPPVLVMVETRLPGDTEMRDSAIAE